jgi:hypothetical protein
MKVFCFLQKSLGSITRNGLATFVHRCCTDNAGRPLESAFIIDCNQDFLEVLGPIAWNSFLLAFAARAAALVAVLARVVPEPYHVDVERGSWLASSRVSEPHHVNGGCR